MPPPPPAMIHRTVTSHIPESRPPPTPLSTPQPQPPQIDLDRVSEEVIRQIERRARIERQRRGMM
ncbi:hypothetical protein [Ruegeria sp. MALMAid1280]|uniref:hypothetical protein n=1 Tax=Ruegeria sp. MALMAid1280 TaxID=3411634 RepID=UPI003BA21936